MKELIPTFKTYLMERENVPTDYGCLMLYVNDDNERADLLLKIAEDDLYDEEEGFGKESEAHVTVLYGYHNEKVDLTKLKEIAQEIPLGDITLKSDKISYFRNDKYDVLKYDIISPELKILNKNMSDNFENTNSFPDYHAHITLAYLKPGLGDKYKHDLKETKEFIPSHFVYSYQKDKHIF